MPENPEIRYGTEGAFSFSRLGDVRYVECRALAECDFITHAFCTRWGGVSEGRLADLNFGMHVGDRDEHLKRNTALLCSAFNIPEHIVSVDQVHGDRLLVIDEAFQGGEQIGSLEYDGIITAIPGIPIGIKTADCVPVLLADRRKRVVGAVHAGWKGTALGIAAKAARVFMQTFSSVPGDILAVIGPAIGPCCYEVDEAVFHRFDTSREETVAFTGGRKEGKWMLDLSAANRSQLQGAGIPRENIFSADICTSCRHDTFFSHRGEAGDTGRQLSLIMLR